MIWTQALVRHRIYITWALCEKTLQEDHTRTCCRVTSPGHSYDSVHGTYVGLQKQPKNWPSRIMAFTLGKDGNLDADNDQPSLNTLLACRQASNEAAAIFYSQNCFVFCATHEREEKCGGSSGLLPAYAFLKDRSKHTLHMIKRIEIQFLDFSFLDGKMDEFNAIYPLTDKGLLQYSSRRHTDLFSLIKANMNLDYLGLYIAGWSISHELPGEGLDCSSDQSVLGGLCGLRQVDRLSINYITRMEPELAAPAGPQGSSLGFHIHPGHGRRCFLEATKISQEYDDEWFTAGCPLAHDSLRAAAFARLLRHYILKNGNKKGYQDIEVIVGTREGIDYLMLSTDDDKVGRSYLGERHGQPQSKPANHDTARIDTFALVGGSKILDEVQPRRWTPIWDKAE